MIRLSVLLAITGLSACCPEEEPLPLQSDTYSSEAARFGDVGLEAMEAADLDIVVDRDANTVQLRYTVDGVERVDTFAIRNVGTGF